jgi:hypothetical protein
MRKRQSSLQSSSEVAANGRSNSRPSDQSCGSIAALGAAANAISELKPLATGVTGGGGVAGGEWSGCPQRQMPPHRQTPVQWQPVFAGLAARAGAAAPRQVLVGKEASPQPHEGDHPPSINSIPAAAQTRAQEASRRCAAKILTLRLYPDPWAGSNGPAGDSR